MREFEKIGEDLFNKIRGRFPKVTIGDANGEITNEPSAARFFDFDYNGLGKVSVSINEDSGLTVIYSKDFMENQDEITRDAWYDFLKELRVFSKKRMLDYSVRDITKSNLDKRDYKFLAKRPGEETMAESKMYGTNRVSYQKVDGARLVVKHTESINAEVTASRTRNIGAIYIESADGERFKYPFKHLSGARAMARHVAEGGKPFDDFGTHITSLSEEMSKLRKFKNYMGRSAVMAESLAGYMDAVHDRIKSVKKTIESLQKPNYYKESFAAFETPMMEDVPADVAENWIDQLTIKQFNEELADVFPYIYKLVSEATKAKELNADDLMSEMDCWDGYKKDGTQAGTGKNKGKRVNKCVPEEIALEQGFEEMMGQFAEAKECDDCGCSPCECDTNEDKVQEAYIKTSKDAIDTLDKVQEAYIKTSKDAIDTLGNLRKIGKSIETGDGEYEGNLANMFANDVYDVISWVENNLDANDPKYKQVIDPVVALRKKAKGMERETGSGKDARFGNEIVNTLYPLMQWIEAAAMDAKEGDDGTEEPKEQKTPLGEFILSYFDKESGQFPKGETAILTMIEKDYGEQFIEPAKQFIEQINVKFEEFQMRTQPQQMEKAPDVLRKAVEIGRAHV